MDAFRPDPKPDLDNANVGTYRFAFAERYPARVPLILRVSNEPCAIRMSGNGLQTMIFGKSGAPLFIDYKGAGQIPYWSLSGVFLHVSNEPRAESAAQSRKMDWQEVRTLVTINGKQENAAGMTVLTYLEHAGFDAKRVVVEINLEIIPQDRLDAVKLETGDQVEILHFVGGG